MRSSLLPLSPPSCSGTHKRSLAQSGTLGSTLDPTAGTTCASAARRARTSTFRVRPPLSSLLCAPAHASTPAVPAHIVTAAVFAPTSTRTHLTAARDPVFADGHTHMAPLSRTMSGASLGLVGTTTRNTTFSYGGLGGADVLVPVTSRDGMTAPAGGALDAILVVADGASSSLSLARARRGRLLVAVLTLAGPCAQTRRASSRSSATRSSSASARRCGDAPRLSRPVELARPPLYTPLSLSIPLLSLELSASSTSPSALSCPSSSCTHTLYR